MAGCPRGHDFCPDKTRKHNGSGRKRAHFEREENEAVLGLRLSRETMIISIRTRTSKTEEEGGREGEQQ